MENDFIKFIRQKDFQFVKELGQGACGKTVLLYDDIIDENFVCKKYSPIVEDTQDILFKKFIQEIKLMHLVNHLNIVRVFNYYIYPSIHLGYILMEYIDGDNIEKYLKKHPQDINEIFVQVIDGFKHLESNNILHRDIRPLNIMVGEDGVVKIIDFGFGKKAVFESDFEKSIDLNWWCPLPDEFENQIYDFKTELYFVGQLFEKIISEYSIEHFKYRSILNQMIKKDPESRPQSFFQINQDIQLDRFDEIDFDFWELKYYREFSKFIFEAISKIERGSKYNDDIDKIQYQLEALYKNCMLEEAIPDRTKLIRIFISGSYYYTKSVFPVEKLKDFIGLLRSCSVEKRNIILSNIHSKLDSITRYDEIPEDDIPF